MPEPDEAGRPVIFYDGVCALCHFAVRFLIARDRAGVLRFAPLQGETFAAFRAATPRQDGLDSVIYVRRYGSGDARVYVRSEAVLQALRDIGGFWRVVSWARIIPRFMRDGLYNFVARRRYGWFGRYDECRLPTPRQREQLLP